MTDTSTSLPPSPRRPNRRRFYSVRQASFELGVSDRTLWRWIKSGKIKTYRLSIGRVGIPVEELDQLETEIRLRGEIEREDERSQVDRDRKRVVRDDDKFFKRNPDRQYRIRRASPVEIRQKELNGGLPTLPQGWGWFLVVRNIAPGAGWPCSFRTWRTHTPTSTRARRTPSSTYAAASCPDLSRRASAVESNHATRH